jgi:predicted transcriptional regulator
MTDDARPTGDGPAAQLVSAFAANGFPRMPASVLMAIMVSEDGALTAEQLADRLGASPAAVSGAVRYLSTVGMVHRHRQPGERRYLYELPEHAWYTASISKNALYPTIARIAESTAKELGPQGAARVREMAGFFMFLEERLPALLEEWNTLRETGERGQSAN